MNTVIDMENYTIQLEKALLKRIDVTYDNESPNPYLMS